MGCDIHLHQEVKIDGKWEHYRETRMERNYQVFAKMAGVRGSERPIAPPRGIPIDASAMTLFCVKHWGPSAHSHSWLGAAEIAELEAWIEEGMGDNAWRLEMDGWGYFFDNSWGSFIKYPDERPKGVEDVRFVFYFDS